MRTIFPEANLFFIMYFTILHDKCDKHTFLVRMKLISQGLLFLAENDSVLTHVDELSIESARNSPKSLFTKYKEIRGYFFTLRNV